MSAPYLGLCLPAAAYCYSAHCYGNDNQYSQSNMDDAMSSNSIFPVLIGVGWVAALILCCRRHVGAAFRAMFAGGGLELQYTYCYGTDNQYSQSNMDDVMSSNSIFPVLIGVGWVAALILGCRRHVGAAFRAMFAGGGLALEYSYSPV